MSITTIDKKENFEQMLAAFSTQLYPSHSFHNLQCHALIDNGFLLGFAVYEQSAIVAMACVIKNDHLMFENEKAICISHYECVDDAAASQTMLEAIAAHCKGLGYQTLIGPLNGSTWKGYRFSVDAISDSYFTEPFHKKYYADQLRLFGFQTAGTYSTQIVRGLKTPNISYNLNEDIVIRNIDMGNYASEVKKIFAFCSVIFCNNFLYTAISEAEFTSKQMALKTLIDPELVLIAEENGTMVGLLLALHDHCCQHEKRLIIKTLGRKSGARYAGVAHELSQRIVNIAKTNNYQSILHAFMHQNNASKNVSRKFSGEPFRSYQLFYKEL